MLHFLVNGGIMTENIKVNWKRLILAMVISIGAGVISWLPIIDKAIMYTTN